MQASIIIIGDEILLGQVVDTNSSEIARSLTREGWSIELTLVVGDNAEDIRRAVEQAMEVSNLVITTGGLGPTKDDITKTELMNIFGGEEVLDSEVLDNVERVFARRGLRLNALTRKQALVPSSAEIIPNALGTAPGMLFRHDGKVLISMPGVPFEAVDMLHKGVMPRIRKLFMPDIEIRHHTLIASGITESDLAEKLSPWEEALPPFIHLAYLPSPGFIKLRLDGIHGSKAILDADFEAALAGLKRLAEPYIIYDGDGSLPEILIEHLRSAGLTVATAESCTGGDIAHQITLVAGCSDVMLGGVVSYSNEVKINVLGVPSEAIAAYGAVSSQVVTAMAQGATRITGAACTMATSGIAGPGGGTDDKPVGTVWIAVHTPKGTVAECFRFPGNRRRVIDRAATQAMLMLLQNI